MTVKNALQNLGVGLELGAQSAQEDRPGKTPLAVDPNPEDLLRVVLELDPRAAVGHHLREIVVGALEGEEDTRRTVELGNDHPLGAVDDEGAGVGHQGKLTEVELLLFDIPNLPRSVLLGIEGDEAEGQPQRDLVGHPTLATLLGRERLTEAHRGAADVADLDPVRVGLAAGRTHHLGFVGIAGLEPLAAVLAVQAEVLETFEDPAPAGPVADFISDELKLAGLTKIGERKNRTQHRLQTGRHRVRPATDPSAGNPRTRSAALESCSATGWWTDSSRSSAARWGSWSWALPPDQ